MAGSALSSLGLGSSGALSYDTIDKLRKVDESAIINPIDRKIEANKTQQGDLSILTTLAAKLKASTSSLSDEMSYLQRTGTSSNSAVSIKAVAGTAIQDFNINVQSLAQQDIYQTSGVASKTANIGLGNDTINIEMDGVTHTINVSSTTTLEGLKDLINDKLNGKASASILNAGGAEPYRLVLKSKETGQNNAITITSGDAATLTTLGLDNADNHIKHARDAKFSYNGVSIQRSSNTVSDLIVGITLTLNEEQTPEKSTSISVVQDWTEVKRNLNSLVSAYNELNSNLNESTKYDKETKRSGTFQGVSQINSLAADIRKQILSVNRQGDALVDFGIELNDGGILEFKEDKFTSKTKSDPKAVQDYFSGSTTYSTTSFFGVEVASGAMDVTSNKLVINGKSITFSTAVGATAEDNLAALRDAINNAGINIDAKIGGNNSIVLQSTIAGDDLSIDGDSATLASLGLAKSNQRSTTTTREGTFTKFNAMLNSYIDKENGVFSIFQKSLTNIKTSLTKEREVSVKRLDDRYETMAARFAAYDRIINQLNNQFNSLSMLIKQSYKES